MFKNLKLKKYLLRILLFVTMILNVYLLYFYKSPITLIIFIIIMLILAVLSVIIDKLTF
ncbi:hypothetical protein ACV3OY_15025 [Clostridium perfringens]